MSDAIVKIFGVVILCLSLTLIPIVGVTTQNDITVQRLTLNAVQNYLDIVTDKGAITVTDYENFISDLHSIGLIYDVTVTREQRLVYQSDVVYMALDIVSPDRVDSEGDPLFQDDIPCKQGDIVKVSVKSKGRTQGQEVAYNVLGLVVPNVEVTMSRVNRN